MISNLQLTGCERAQLIAICERRIGHTHDGSDPPPRDEDADLIQIGFRPAVHCPTPSAVPLHDQGGECAGYRAQSGAQVDSAGDQGGGGAEDTGF